MYVAGCDEVYPGDVYKIGAAAHIECMPLVAPCMSDLDCYAHTFFVPNRLIYGVDTNDGKPIWEKFITGDEDGLYDTPLPAWSPSWSSTEFSSGKIWDAVGNPVAHTGTPKTWTPLVPSGVDVSIAPRNAYNMIWNAFYRDENLQTEVALTNEDLLYADWRKDYFTSALEFQQRGLTPALPISGLLPLQYDTSAQASTSLFPGIVGGVANGLGVTGTAPNLSATDTGDDAQSLFAVGGANASHKLAYVNLGNSVTFTIHDLRLAFAQQRLMELSARSGVRYTEWLHANFGANPTDARLDRPEYIGGCKIPVMISPVVQTSGTQNNTGTQLTPQGHKAGIGSGNGSQKIGNYRGLEHGVLITLMSIRPKASYHQGVNKQWLRQSRWSYYNPAFANISEVGVFNCEIYTDPSDGLDSEMFGFQTPWNEMRAKQNIVSGAIHDQFNYWSLFRDFASRPALNADFISLNHPEEYNRIFAVQNEDHFIVAWSNILDAYRPIPATGEPGLIDHVYGGL
nr:MAG: major capsid protein [Microviridae sp.]